jgi:hypothetical protein
MTDDDDALRDLDLHAWAAPSAPKGLADTVIARTVGADEAIAVTMHNRRRSRAIVAAACAGTVAAGIAAWLGVRAMRVTHDDIIVAMEPRRLEVGGATVDVEAGTTIRAYRAGDELHVVQSGAATWHVPADEHLVIDAGSSASIDATGASLRVETKMNTQNALVLSGVALAAAAVALVGATVYEGHAKVSDGPHVTVVGPNDSYKAAVKQLVVLQQLQHDIDKQRAALDDNSIRWMPFDQRADLTIAAGESPVIHAQGAVGVDFHWPCVAEVWLTHLAADGSRSTHVVAASLQLEPGTYEYEGSCQYPGLSLRGTIEVVGLHEGNQLVSADTVLDSFTPEHGISSLNGTAERGGVTLSLGDDPIAVDRDGGFSIDFADTHNRSIALRVQGPSSVEYYVYQSAGGGAATVKKPAKPTVVMSVKLACKQVACAVDNYQGACCAKFGKPKPKCDTDASINAGTVASSTGDYRGALRNFAEAFGCKADLHTRALAYMAACNAHDLDSAQYFWRQMSGDEQNRYLIMCVRSGISRDALDGK